MLRLNRSKALGAGLQLLFTAIVLFFLGRVVLAAWPQIIAFPWRFRALPLLGSIALQMLAGFFWASIWRRIVLRSGCTVGWPEAVGVYMVSNLVKYVPGSIWGYVSRAYMGKDHGLTAMGVGISTVWEVGITVVASLLLTAVTIPAYPVTLPRPIWQLVLAAALACLVLLLPPVFNRWVRLLKGWRLWEGPSVFQWRDFGLFLVCAFVTHVLVGTAFFMFASSFVQLDVRCWWAFVGLWSFSSTAGLLIVLAPYGLGVKEGLLALLLQGFMPLGAAALVSVASRLWIVIVEVLEVAAALVLLWRHRQDSP